jgi:protein-L-isoaspartate(D-aspartate) O-methyltransferase
MPVSRSLLKRVNGSDTVHLQREVLNISPFVIRLFRLILCIAIRNNMCLVTLNSNLKAVFSLALLMSVLHSCAQDQFAVKRQKMVAEQIRARGVTDPKVIEAMVKVERHMFVPAEYAERAYDDGPLPIGYGQTISQPYIVAYMTEILQPGSSDRILEIGTGSGYQAAILARICSHVYTIEVIPQLGERAKNLLAVLGFENISVRIGDGYQGWPEHAPFDAIIVTCAPTHIPKALQEQLREGGRMIIPVGDRYVQELVLLEKIDGKMKKKSVLPVMFVPMIDEHGKPY